MQSFCFYSRAAAYLGRSQSSARREQDKEKACFFFSCRAAAYLGRSQSSARRAKRQIYLSTSEPKLPMGEINRSRSPRWQSISQKSARRLEISAVLAEISKRLVNFCSPQVCFSDKVSGMRGPVAETDDCRPKFFSAGNKTSFFPTLHAATAHKKSGMPAPTFRRDIPSMITAVPMSEHQASCSAIKACMAGVAASTLCKSLN